jgi:ESCRT-II complex subunit VPS22
MYSDHMQLKQQLELFKSFLQEFAVKYKKDIRKDPEFRMQFQRMCNQIGVDPLACKLHYISI